METVTVGLVLIGVAVFVSVVGAVVMIEAVQRGSVRRPATTDSPRGLD